MSTNIFSSKTGTVKLPDSTDPILVSIVAHSPTGGARTNCSNLPLISIDELTSSDRVQVDCSLDGVFHILKAAGGFGSCQLTFMDAIHGCSGSSSGFNSALKEYVKRRKRDEGSVVDVTIKLPKENVVFRGYLVTCSASLKKYEGDMALLLVSYRLLGDFDA